MTANKFALALVAEVRDVFGTKEFIPLHAPSFRGKEREYVLTALDSTFVSSVGKSVDEFELAIASYTGAKYAIAVSSGTAALHSVLHAVGVTAGDEVITSPLTFVATCNAIDYCGAKPVFVDVDQDTLGLSPQSLAKFLEQCAEIRDDGFCYNHLSGQRIRACVPIHNLGHPMRASNVAAICEKYNILLIEDAAESLGSLSGARHTGRAGLAGVLSFNGNKIITTGSGGAIITDDENLAIRLKHLTTTAKLEHPWLYRHDEVGFNYRLPNLNAALGLGQIEQLNEFVRMKRALSKHYADWLSGRPEAEYILEPSGTRSNYWLNALFMRSKQERDELLAQTNKCGVMTRPMWTPMNTLPMYKNCQQFNLSHSKLVEETLVCIPSSATPDLSASC